MRGSLREYRPGCWELRVRTGRDPLTGRYGKISRTVNGSRRQAEAELVRLCAEVADGRHPPTNQTVGGLLDRWLEQLQMLGRAPKTIDGTGRWSTAA